MENMIRNWKWKILSATVNGKFYQKLEMETFFIRNWKWKNLSETGNGKFYQNTLRLTDMCVEVLSIVRSRQ